jgi:hypothetical protein
MANARRKIVHDGPSPRPSQSDQPHARLCHWVFGKRIGYAPARAIMRLATACERRKDNTGVEQQANTLTSYVICGHLVCHLLISPSSRKRAATQAFVQGDGKEWGFHRVDGIVTIGGQFGAKHFDNHGTQFVKPSQNWTKCRQRGNV